MSVAKKRGKSVVWFGYKLSTHGANILYIISIFGVIGIVVSMVFMLYNLFHTIFVIGTGVLLVGIFWSVNYYLIFFVMFGILLIIFVYTIIVIKK